MEGPAPLAFPVTCVRVHVRVCVRAHPRGLIQERPGQWKEWPRDQGALLGLCGLHCGSRSHRPHRNQLTPLTRLAGPLSGFSAAFPLSPSPNFPRSLCPWLLSPPRSGLSPKVTTSKKPSLTTFPQVPSPTAHLVTSYRLPLLFSSELSHIKE